MAYMRAMDKDTIRDWRAARSMSQATLAKLLDVQIRTIQRWEAGAVPVPHVVALALAELARRHKPRQAAE